MLSLNTCITINQGTKNQNVWRPSTALSCILGCNFGSKILKKRLKIRRIFKNSQTEFKGFVKTRGSSQTRTFDRTEEPCIYMVLVNSVPPTSTQKPLCGIRWGLHTSRLSWLGVYSKTWVCSVCFCFLVWKCLLVSRTRGHCAASAGVCTPWSWSAEGWAGCRPGARISYCVV